MSKKYIRVQKNFNKDGISRVPHSVSPKLGPVTPCNCSHPCPYGNGRTFCFPCYQKLVADSRSKVIVNYNHFLGYTKDENGKLVIVEEEAKIIRRIYREFLDGATCGDIKKGLERDKLMTGAKGYRWHESTILGILTNEKYIGDALLQKTITTDFIEKTRIKNDGSVPQYYVTDDHEAIIPRDIFAEVQEEIQRRQSLANRIPGKKRIYNNKYALGYICTCVKCGDIYRRVHYAEGLYKEVWRCCTRLEGGPTACDASTVVEPDLHEAVVKAINQVMKCSPTMKDTLMQNIKTALADDNSPEIEKINKKLSDKQDEIVKLAQAKKDYTALADELDRLNEEKQEILAKKVQRESLKNRIRELEEFIQQTGHEITEYDEKLVRRYIKEIKIHEDRFQVIFKAGIDIDIPRDR
ncbi:recombinase family protein [Butyrivibrio sp. LC3010]|uniref:recombinase family protein n=1 Tax=Butyrivibrio sp. LC3010 TaxID=1280680 RepID=UPI0003F7A91B|nr:recombinase family protein [Butyrivibrio sp. LC3010]